MNLTNNQKKIGKGALIGAAVGACAGVAGLGAVAGAYVAHKKYCDKKKK